MIRAALLSIASCFVITGARAGDPATVVAAAPDPIEGRWLGVAGLPGDRTDYGLDVRRDEKGELAAFLCAPVLNVYGMAAGAVRVDGGAYAVDGLGLKLTLEGDVLDGTFSSLKVPVTMKRVADLPREAPIPELPRGPEPRAKAKLGAPIWAGVAARDGIAYVGTAGGVMHAVSLKDGALVWTFNAGRPIHGEALAGEESLHFVCDDGNLYKLDRKSGKEVWRYDLGDAKSPRILPHPSVYEYDYSSPRPTLFGGTIYVGSGDGGVHAVNDATGERAWRFACGDRVRTDALVEGDRVFVGSFDGHVYALERATGAVSWKKNLFAPVTTSPAIVDGSLVIGARTSVLYRMKPADGEIEWRALFWGSWVESQAVSFDGRLYVGSSDLRRVSCYDPANGALVWRTDVYGCPWARPLVTDTTVYVSVVGADPYMIRHQGSLCALDRASGKIRWCWRTQDAAGSYLNGFVGAPAIDGDRLAAPGLDGTLYVFALD